MTRLFRILFFVLLASPAFAGNVIKMVEAGAVDQTVVIKIIDLSDGSPELGVLFNAAGIDLEYWRHGPNAVTDITEVTQTVNGAHTDGGFVEIGHGMYRLDLPDAAVATGATAVEIQGTVTGMIVIGGTVMLSPPVNAVQISGDGPAADNAEAFFDGTGYAGTGNTIPTVTSVTNGVTVATNNDKTGYSLTQAFPANFADLSITVTTGRVDVASVAGTAQTANDNGADINAILVDTGTTLETHLTDIKGVTFSGATDSLEAIRDRGDAAWTTGSGTGLTAIATGTAQSATGTTLVLAAGETFADDELIGAVLQITGGTTGVGQTRCITDNVGSTDTITVDTFTTTPTGTITYEIAPSLGGTCPLQASSGASTLNVTASGNIGIDWANVENATSTVALSNTTVGTVSTLTGHTAQTGDSFARLGVPAGASIAADVAAVKADSAAILIDTAEIGVAGAGLTNINLPNQTMDMVGNITGNLSGSVGSVTGNVGGNVTGSVGSVVGHTPQTGDTYAALEMQRLLDTALLNCEVNTANFAGSTTTLACILTDRDDAAVTQATGDLQGQELVVMSGAQIREKRFIIATTWDGVNSELQLTLSRALPGTLADAVTAIIR